MRKSAMQERRRHPKGRPLAGKTILITRPRSQSREFARRIRSLGGNALFFPTIKITAPASWADCDNALNALHRYDGLIFTSANGIRFFLARAGAHNARVNCLRSMQLFVVGGTTERIARKHGLKVTAVPETYDAHHMAFLFSEESVKGKTFLFPRGNLSRDDLAAHLRSLGASVDAIAVYQTTKPKNDRARAVRARLLNSGIDVITFASPSAADNFASMFSPDELQRILRTTRIAVIGSTTSSAVQKAGMRADIVPSKSSIGNLLESIIRYVQDPGPPSRFPRQPDDAPMNDLFLRACFRKDVERTPVWIMRQAGRYLPEYRAVRASVDFLTLCKTPELAAQVTIQPVDILGVDAAIIFSDILVVPEAMGMELVVDEGKGGPQFPRPIRSRHDIAALSVPDPADRLRFVLDAIRLTRSQLGGRVPLIGFSGSPWTMAAYMVEGHGSTGFRRMKQLIYNSPDSVHELLEKLASAVSLYLNSQIEAGVQAIQIFDTLGGILTSDAFKEFSLPYIEQVVERVQAEGVPVIVFCKDCGHSLEEIAACGCHVVGLDWTIDIGGARKRVGSTVALQGNMDPQVLFAKPDRIREEVKKVLQKFGHGPGHIFNLGHGILPNVPVDHAKALVEAVREESVHFHASPFN